jgi:uncharacterized membrane protein YfhO
MFVQSYVVQNTPQQIIDTVYNPATQLDKMVILEKKPVVLHAGQYVGDEKLQAAITSYDLNSVTITTNSPIAGFVVLTDNYYPGWKVTVDGKPSELYRADYALRAVEVQAGDHTIIFSYTPITFTIGIGITCIGLLLSAALFIYLHRNSRDEKK